MKEILERIEKQINILQEKYKDDFFEYQLNDGATDEDTLCQRILRKSTAFIMEKKKAIV